jgi:hypothetical protein
MLSYFAVAQNDSVGRVRYQLMEKMLQPCGRPPVPALREAIRNDAER